MNDRRMHRKRELMSKPGALVDLWDQVYREPGYWVGGIRCKGHVNLIWASVRNHRNQTVECKRENPQMAKTMREKVPMSTVWDRPTRMSDEGGNVLEQRGGVNWPRVESTHFRGRNST